MAIDKHDTSVKDPKKYIQKVGMIIDLRVASRESLRYMLVKFKDESSLWHTNPVHPSRKANYEFFNKWFIMNVVAYKHLLGQKDAQGNILDEDVILDVSDEKYSFLVKYLYGMKGKVNTYSVLSDLKDAIRSLFNACNVQGISSITIAKYMDVGQPSDIFCFWDIKDFVDLMANGQLPKTIYDVQIPKSSIDFETAQKLVDQWDNSGLLKEFVSKSKSGNKKKHKLAAYVNDFDAFIKDRRRGFKGRDFVFEKIEEFINNPDTISGYFVISGDPGIGKSAIIAELVVRWSLPVYHFNIALQSIDTPGQCIRNICARIISESQLPYGELPGDCDKDDVFLSKILDEAAAKLEKGKKLVIAIDALDELRYDSTTTRANPLFLPIALPDNIYFVVTARRRQDAEIQASCIEYYPLEANGHENRKDIEAFIADSVAKIRIRKWMEKQKLNESQFIDKMWQKSEGNFMYLRHMLPAIEQGRFSEGNIDELPHGLRAYYRCHWGQMRQYAGETFEEQHQLVVCSLAAAQEAITLERVVLWTQLSARQVKQIFNDWAEFLHIIPITEEKKKYRLYHKAFRDFLQEEVNPGLKKYHAMIGDIIWKDIEAL